MRRDVILVVGKTGFGKSNWTRKFLRGVNRLMVYDPLGETDAAYLDDDNLFTFLDTPSKTFRIGTTSPDSLDILGHGAYVMGNCWLAIEEAATVFNRGENLPDWARDAVFLGRHRALSLIIVAQRAATVPIAFRSQISRVVAFAQHEKDDLKYLAGIIGDDADRLPELPPHRCLDFWPALHPALDEYTTKYA